MSPTDGHAALNSPDLIGRVVDPNKLIASKFIIKECNIKIKKSQICLNRISMVNT